jgi:hypothetical protein
MFFPSIPLRCTAQDFLAVLPLLSSDLYRSRLQSWLPIGVISIPADTDPDSISDSSNAHVDTGGDKAMQVEVS